MLWTGTVGPRYAPDVQVVGVAAIAPAANMMDILTTNLASNNPAWAMCCVGVQPFLPDVRFEWMAGS